jgi:hypothetical protein
MILQGKVNLMVQLAQNTSFSNSDALYSVHLTECATHLQVHCKSGSGMMYLLLTIVQNQWCVVRHNDLAMVASKYNSCSYVRRGNLISSLRDRQNEQVFHELGRVLTQEGWTNSAIS